MVVAAKMNAAWPWRGLGGEGVHCTFLVASAGVQKGNESQKINTAIIKRKSFNLPVK